MGSVLVLEAIFITSLGALAGGTYSSILKHQVLMHLSTKELRYKSDSVRGIMMVNSTITSIIVLARCFSVKTKSPVKSGACLVIVTMWSFGFVIVREMWRRDTMGY
jgi:hypothetical protein